MSDDDCVKPPFEIPVTGVDPHRVPFRVLLGNPYRFYDPATQRVYDSRKTNRCLACGTIESRTDGFNAKTRLCRACTAKGVRLLTDALEPLGLARTPVRFELAFDGLAKLVGYFRAFRR